MLLLACEGCCVWWFTLCAISDAAAGCKAADVILTIAPTDRKYIRWRSHCLPWCQSSPCWCKKYYIFKFSRAHIFHASCATLLKSVCGMKQLYFASLGSLARNFSSSCSQNFLVFLPEVHFSWDWCWGLQNTLEEYVCCLYFITTVFITVGFGIVPFK